MTTKERQRQTKRTKSVEVEDKQDVIAVSSSAINRRSAHSVRIDFWLSEHNEFTRIEPQWFGILLNSFQTRQLGMAFAARDGPTGLRP